MGKTVAVGVPLINTIYDHNPNVGLYTLPLLVWHPTQLLVGSFLAPRLAAFVKREEARLAGVSDASIKRIPNGGTSEQVSLLTNGAHGSSKQGKERNQSRRS